MCCYSSLVVLQVLVPKDPLLLGKMFEVVITSTGKHYLKGDVVTESLVRVPPRPTPLPTGAVSGRKEWREKQSQNQIVPKRTMCSGDLLFLFSILFFICAAIVIQYGPRIPLLFSSFP